MLFDLIIVGSGAAGLTLSLTLAKQGVRIALLSKGELDSGGTMHAQGGIAAVMSENDSIESHIKDTIRAGAGLCNPKVVKFVVTHAKDAINWLIDEGVAFTKHETSYVTKDFSYHLTKEGGHSHRRILHAKDATGEAIQTTLSKLLKNYSNIKVFTQHTAVDLIKTNHAVTGVYVYNNKTLQILALRAKSVVLATGGASKVYLYTSNPDGSSGDGIAMAYRAGAEIKNMEFNQFHPTCLYHPKAKSFLISEAVRGEGGLLLLPNGKRFMPKFHKDAELAPRDIVARAIDQVMKRYGLDCVYLDISY